MRVPRSLAATTLAAVLLAATVPGASAQFVHGARAPSPSPVAPSARPSAPLRSVAPSQAPEPETTATSILRDSRLTDILRYQTLLRENPSDSDYRLNLIKAAWSNDQNSVIVIGVGAQHPIRFMQKRAAAVDCARWFAYHQAWRRGEKKDFGSIHAQVTGAYTPLLEEVLPDGRLAVVRRYTFGQ